MINEVLIGRKKIVVEKGKKAVVVISPVIDDYELSLTEKEIDGIEAGVKKFRKSFKLSF